MLIYEGNLHKKIGAISQLGAEKIAFPPKPDRQTYRHTYRRTDIYFYRVALLLKIFRLMIKILQIKENYRYIKKINVRIQDRE